MFKSFLHAKIHRATVTHCELHYEGSCGIDQTLLDASGIRPNEQVHIWNITNGERFVTYAISSPAGSGVISLNGSAARRASVGDLVIIAAFASVHEDKLDQHRPRLVFVDEVNRITELRDAPAGPFAGMERMVEVEQA